MENLLALMYTVFSFCYSSEVNITFHNNETTWIGAVEYCKSIGAVLYSDEKDIRNRTVYAVWTGKYKILTPWVITWGCYEIDRKKVFEVPRGIQAECQKKCMETYFFAIKQTTCMCLQLADLKTDKIKGPCTCSTCFIVLRHRFFDFRRGTSCGPEDNTCFCMAAACTDRNLKLTSEQCITPYKITCDDRTEYPDGGYGSNLEAKTFCNNRSSFVRWYEKSDICPNGSAQHWTSGMRQDYGNRVQYTDEVSKLNPLECFRVTHQDTVGREYVECDNLFPFFCQSGSSVHEDTTSGSQSNDSNNTAGEDDTWKPLQCKIKEGETSEDLMLVKHSSNHCSDLRSFYCSNGSKPQKSKTTIMEAQENNVTMSVEFDLNSRSPHNTSNMITGVIVGTVLSIIAIGVVIFVVIVVRRRRSAMRNPIPKQDVHGPNDTEKIEHLENKNGYAYSEIEMEATNKKDHMDNGDNEYTTGTSDVYDHLNEHKNRKIQTENPHAIYDHAIGDKAEPDYDSTKHVVPTNPEYQEVRICSEVESYREKL